VRLTKILKHLFARQVMTLNVRVNQTKTQLLFFVEKLFPHNGTKHGIDILMYLNMINNVQHYPNICLMQLTT
jgi:hypothetical protein